MLRKSAHNTRTGQQLVKLTWATVKSVPLVFIVPREPPVSQVPSTFALSDTIAKLIKHHSRVLLAHITHSMGPHRPMTVNHVNLDTFVRLAQHTVNHVQSVTFALEAVNRNRFRVHRALSTVELVRATRPDVDFVQRDTFVVTQTSQHGVLQQQQVHSVVVEVRSHLNVQAELTRLTRDSSRVIIVRLARDAQ